MLYKSDWLCKASLRKDTADMNNLNIYENEYPCLAGHMDWQNGANYYSSGCIIGGLKLPISYCLDVVL